MTSLPSLCPCCGHVVLHPAQATKGRFTQVKKMGRNWRVAAACYNPKCSQYARSKFTLIPRR